MSVTSDDYNCVARCIVLADGWGMGHHHKKWRNLGHSRSALQTKLTYDMQERAGLSPGIVTVADVEKFQSVLFEYQLIVHHKPHADGILHEASLRRNLGYFFRRIIS